MPRVFRLDKVICDLVSHSTSIFLFRQGLICVSGWSWTWTPKSSCLHLVLESCITMTSITMLDLCGTGDGLGQDLTHARRALYTNRSSSSFRAYCICRSLDNRGQIITFALWAKLLCVDTRRQPSIYQESPRLYNCDNKIKRFPYKLSDLWYSVMVMLCYLLFWRYGSAVTSTNCSSGGPKFNSHWLYGDPKPSVMGSVWCPLLVVLETTTVYSHK